MHARQPDRLRRLESLLETPMVVLALVWLILFVVELTRGLGPLLTTLVNLIWIAFILEFSLRLWLAVDKWGYLRRNWLTALSLAVPALRAVRALRAFMVLRAARGVRLVRVVGSLNRALRALGGAFGRRGLGYVVAASLVVVLVSSAAILAFEPDGFAHFGDAVWWVSMMILNVGSEVWPVTFEGRALAFLLALYGFSILGYVAATLTSLFLGRDGEVGRDVQADAVASLTAEVEALRRDLAKRDDAS